MPISLPENYKDDQAVLALLTRVASSGGALLVSDQDQAELEGSAAFRHALQRGLIDLDEGGEWSAGMVLSLTPSGHRQIGSVREPGIVRAMLDRMLRRARRGAHG